MTNTWLTQRLRYRDDTGRHGWNAVVLCKIYVDRGDHIINGQAEYQKLDGNMRLLLSGTEERTNTKCKGSINLPSSGDFLLGQRFYRSHNADVHCIKLQMSQGLHKHVVIVVPLRTDEEEVDGQQLFLALQDYQDNHYRNVLGQPLPQDLEVNYIHTNTQAIAPEVFRLEQDDQAVPVPKPLAKVAFDFVSGTIVSVIRGVFGMIVRGLYFGGKCLVYGLLTLFTTKGNNNTEDNTKEM